MQSITLPQKPKYISDDGKNGKFQIEACYPGYGTTLGNALRRVLLSSMPGSAITSVKIKGVKHEFSTIPGVLEDVIQIILNLKQVRFKTFKDGPIEVTLSAKGEKTITAGMIKCSSDIEVVSKDAHIATITNAKGELEIEMEVENGIGYVPIEQQIREKKEVGVIALDAIFTPIRRVNYVVENMRVGKRTDFERIKLEIVTDGSVSPKEAFDKAVEILINQFSVLSEVEQISQMEENSLADDGLVTMEVEKDNNDKNNGEIENNDAAKTAVVDLKGLSTRTLNVLEKNNVTSVEDIMNLTEVQINELDGMGEKGIKEIKKAIGDFGINLKKEN